MIFFKSVLTKKIPVKKFFSTGLSNKNLLMMKKLKNFRNNTLNVDFKGSELIFQTIWSDFVHFSLFDKNFNNQNFNSEFDYFRYDEESYSIFQDENIFSDYLAMDYQEGINLLTQENEMKISHTENEIDGKYKNLTLITRIPQEFNLNLKTDKNIKIINTGDSKLIADKKISIEFYSKNKINSSSESDLNSLEARRLRTTNFNLSALQNKLIVSIRSYLEAEFINFISVHKSILRIKKLGVVKEGFFHLRETNLDIRSIYGPVEKEGNNSKNKQIKFKVEGGNLNIGSIQGNVIFEISDSEKDPEYESNLFIDNLDCENFIFKSEALNLNRCEVFINKINSSSLFDVRNVKNFVLFLNIDKKDDFVVSHNNTIIFGSYHKDKSVIEVNSKTKPEILEVSSWDYMKRRIERKINSKNKI